MSGPGAPGWQPRLIALDVDGTLVNGVYATSTVVDAAVRRATVAGAHVVIATGRGLVRTHPIVERLGLVAAGVEAYAVASNGSVVARLGADGATRLLRVSTFDPRPVFAHLLPEFPDAMVAVETVDDIGIGYRVNTLFPPEDLGGRLVVVGLDELGAEPVTRAIVRLSPGDTARLRVILDRVDRLQVAHYLGYNGWLDLAPGGVSKQFGLADVAAALEVEPDEVLAIGDGTNDIEMLTWAGRGVAMGDASQEVKDAADAITAGVADDGVALELDRWFSAGG